MSINAIRHNGKGEMTFLEPIGLNSFSFLSSSIYGKHGMMWALTCHGRNKPGLEIINRLNLNYPMRLWTSVSWPLKGKAWAKKFLQSCSLTFYVLHSYSDKHCMPFHLSVAQQSLGQESAAPLWQECGKVCLWIGTEWPCLLVPDLNVYLYSLNYSTGWIRGEVTC